MKPKNYDKKEKRKEVNYGFNQRHMSVNALHEFDVVRKKWIVVAVMPEDGGIVK